MLNSSNSYIWLLAIAGVLIFEKGGFAEADPAIPRSGIYEKSLNGLSEKKSLNGFNGKKDANEGNIMNIMNEVMGDTNNLVKEVMQKPTSEEKVNHILEIIKGYMNGDEMKYLDGELQKNFGLNVTDVVDKAGHVLKAKSMDEAFEKLKETTNGETMQNLSESLVNYVAEKKYEEPLENMAIWLRPYADDVASGHMSMDEFDWETLFDLLHNTGAMKDMKFSTLDIFLIKGLVSTFAQGGESMVKKSRGGDSGNMKVGGGNMGDMADLMAMAVNSKAGRYKDSLN